MIAALRRRARDRRDAFEDRLDRMWWSLRTTERYWLPDKGWYHSTRTTAAHWWDRGYPVCQDSDPGLPIWHAPHARGIGRICPTCLTIIRSRLIHALNRRHSPVGGAAHG